jgi:hypothetical protein
MHVLKKLWGTIENYFQLGINSHGIANNSTGIEARTGNNANRSNFISIQSSLDEHCANRLDLKQRDVFLDFGFDGTTGIPIGAPVGTYGICHTSGGGYIAGDIYLVTGVSTGVIIPMYRMMNVCNLNAFAGTISMIAKGYYSLNSTSSPWNNWVLFGNGSGTVGCQFNVLTKNANYPAVIEDFILANTSGGSFDITLPTAVGNIGHQIGVKKISSDGYFVNIVPFGTEQIDGEDELSVNGQYNSLIFISDGSDWYII